MSRLRSVPVLTTSIIVAVGLAVGLTACSGGGDPAPSRSAGGSATATASPSASGESETTPLPSSASRPTAEPTGSADDGTGPGTGNGSGVEQPSSVDFGKIAAQGVAAAGGGTVLSLAGSGDSWTVVVAGSDGSQTQSVVSATLDRVTSGPFPKQVDAATQTTTSALTSALRVDAPTAAADAERAASGGTLRSLVLGGTGSAPVWTATVDSGGSSRTVTVDGRTGAAAAS